MGHANGASLFLLLMFLHVARRMYYNSSNKITLDIENSNTIAFDESGFLGVRATVWSNVLLEGYVVSKFTLTRFYTLHFLLPPAMAVLLLRHLHLLHGTRGSSLSYASVKLSFFPFFAVKDAMMWLFYLTVFLLFVCLYSNLLGDAENYIPANPLVTPVHIKPEWYFLFAYAILRCIPNKTLRVLALAAAVVVPIIQALRFSSSASTSIGFLAFTFCLLTALGGMPIVKHYFLLSQCFSLIYFRLVTILA